MELILRTAVQGKGEDSKQSIPSIPWLPDHTLTNVSDVSHFFNSSFRFCLTALQHSTNTIRLKE
jgi:hypothetical protein